MITIQLNDRQTLFLSDLLGITRDNIESQLQVEIERNDSNPETQQIKNELEQDLSICASIHQQITSLYSPVPMRFFQGPWVPPGIRVIEFTDKHIISEREFPWILGTTKKFLVKIMIDSRQVILSGKQLRELCREIGKDYDAFKAEIYTNPINAKTQIDENW